MSEPGFWDDAEKAQGLMKEQKALKDLLEELDTLDRYITDIEALIELIGDLGSEGDPQERAELETEIDSLYRALEQDYTKLDLKTKLKGEYDANNAILSIHAGAGGTDAQDWAAILLRMYRRWGNDHGYQVATLDLLEDPEAGIKSATLIFQGTNAYGYLKSEKGVHRLVRISPFNTSGKRMTSFASVDVMPELTDDSVVEINPADLEIDTYRSSGAGGQHVNTTDSAVRITHKPTGIVVQCQNERSQISNRATAMRMLASKLTEIKIAEHKDKISEIAGDYSQITWGSQIRSYVFHPYNMVKDHRTEHETGNVQAVIDGEIDPFIEAYLRSL